MELGFLFFSRPAFLLKLYGSYVLSRAGRGQI